MQPVTEVVGLVCERQLDLCWHESAGVYRFSSPLLVHTEICPTFHNKYFMINVRFREGTRNIGV